MRHIRIVSIFILAILLCSCEKETSHLFVTEYANSDGVHYVYDQNGENYIEKDGMFISTQQVDIEHVPALKYYEVREPYTISQNFVGNYKCRPLDAFAYVTHLRDKGFQITYYEYKPYMCTLTLNKDIVNYKIYIEDNTTRIYSWDANGKILEPQEIDYYAQD